MLLIDAVVFIYAKFPCFVFQFSFQSPLYNIAKASINDLLKENEVILQLDNDLLMGYWYMAS